MKARLMIVLEILSLKRVFQNLALEKNFGQDLNGFQKKLNFATWWRNFSGQSI